MRPSEVVRRGAEYLAGHGVDAADVNAERLMLAVLGTDRRTMRSRDDGLSTAEARAYGRALCRRCTGTPLQHLTGEEGFRHLVVKVRPGVFVPRPETEVLVEQALGRLAAIVAPRVADPCTGTGVIALSIAFEHPGAQVIATDLAVEAVALARENAVALGLEVEIERRVLLDGVDGPLDLVTCNPPYVAEAARPDLPREVLADPYLAVHGEIEIYERLFAQAFARLRRGGSVLVEIEESAAPAVSRRARDAGFVEVAVHSDLNGRPRVIEDAAAMTSPLDEAVAAVDRGALIVMPTDTVYGIAGRPDDPDVTASLFTAKERPAGLTLPVLVATVDEARSIAALDGRAEVLAGSCWPGPLTIVAPRSPSSAMWDLGGHDDTLGVRVPSHPLALAVLAATGPLAVTSANRSGDPAARTCDELVAVFGDRVAVYLCEDVPIEGAASTVIDLAHGPARVLREGDIDAATLARLLPAEEALIDSRPS